MDRKQRTPPPQRMPRSPDIDRNRDLIDVVQGITRPSLQADTDWVYVTPLAPAATPPDFDPDDPISPEFVNGWGNSGGSFAPCSFHLSADGEVRMRGHLQGGQVGAVAFQLPLGFRPEHAEQYILPGDNSGYSVWKVESNGDVLVVRQVA